MSHQNSLHKSQATLVPSRCTVRGLGIPYHGVCYCAMLKAHMHGIVATVCFLQHFSTTKPNALWTGAEREPYRSMQAFVLIRLTEPWKLLCAGTLSCQHIVSWHLTG
uniref:Uncharacterized protein n=1 Tax=Arundo donax TaxID=35708 RepID=A0A0A9DH88_ARUDO